MTLIGVLALQGGYGPHADLLRALGYRVVLVRRSGELAELQGLVLPGGESGAQLRLIDRLGLGDPLRAFAASGRPILATCAGLVLAAREVRPPQPSFGWLDVSVERNGWGRQVHSFEATADGESALPLVFIRAPRLRRIGPGVVVLHTYEGEPVALRQGNLVAATFHPELSGDARLHRAAFTPPR